MQNHEYEYQITIPEFVRATGGIYADEAVRRRVVRGEIRGTQSGRGGTWKIPVSEVSRFLEREGVLQEAA